MYLPAKERLKFLFHLFIVYNIVYYTNAECSFAEALAIIVDTRTNLTEFA